MASMGWEEPDAIYRRQYHLPEASAPPFPADTDVDVSQAGPAEETGGSMDSECPVCMDSISDTDSAMRCTGASGVHHMFHAHCMNGWLKSCRDRNLSPSCPVCRGPVQIHKRRLQDFLDSDQSDKLDSESIGLMQGLLDTINSRFETLSSGWSSALTEENLLNTAGILGSVAYGFYNGVYNRNSYWETTYFYQHATQPMMVANSIGWMFGTGWRLYWSAQARKEEEERERRERRERQDHVSDGGTRRR